MKLSLYQELARAAEQAQLAVVEEVMARLAAHYPPPPKLAAPHSRFLRVLSWRYLDGWNVADYEREHEYLANVRYVLSRSQDLAATLRKIVTYGNIASRKSATAQYYRKMPPADVALIATYLEEQEENA
jgi:hypothetical protein